MSGIDIKKRRKELGLSQTDLAEKLGVSMNTIYNWERGGVIPGTAVKRLKEVLFGIEEKPNEKSQRIDSLKAEIYEATNNLINVLDDQIAEAKKNTSTLKSVEELQQLLRLKLELVDQLQESMR